MPHHRSTPNPPTRPTRRAALGALLGAAATYATAAPALPHCPDRALRVAFDDRGHNYFRGVGFDLDLMQEWRGRTGCAMSFAEMPRARIFASLERGELDMAMFVIQTPERDRYAWFAHYMVQKNYVLLRPALAARVAGMAAFERDTGLNFGIVRGFTHGPVYEAFLLRLRAAGRVVEVDSTEQLLRMVLANRVQAVMSLPTVLELYRRKIVPEATTLIDQDWDPGSAAPPHGLMMSRKTFDEPAAQAWQALVSTSLADGSVRRTIARYVSGRDLERSLLP